MKRFWKSRFLKLFVFLLVASSVGMYFTIFWLGPAIMCGEKRTEFHAKFYKAYTPANFNLEAVTSQAITEDSTAISFLHCKQEISNFSHGTFIIIHGVGAVKEAMLGAAKRATSSGFDAVVYDSRAHGASGGQNCTYGYHERKDVSALIDFLADSGDEGPFYVWGVSMGGAIGILSTADDPRIKGAIIESTFSRLDEIANDYFERIVHFRFPWLIKQVLIESEKQAQFVVDEVSPEELCSKIDVPILMIHGEADQNINVAYAKRNYAALKTTQKHLYLVPGADHSNVWQIDPDGVERAWQEFVERYFVH